MRMQAPTSSYGCFNLDCIACHGDAEWKAMRAAENNAATTIYVCGTNMPGYLPEGDLYYTTEEDSAAGFIIEEMLGDATIADDTDEHDLAEELSSEAEDLNVTNVEQGWSTIVGNVAYWINVTTLGELADDADIDLADDLDSILDRLNGAM